MDKILKMKKCVWNFTQVIGKVCVAFNETFRQNKILSSHLSRSEKQQEKKKSQIQPVFLHRPGMQILFIKQEY